MYDQWHKALWKHLKARHSLTQIFLVCRMLSSATWHYWGSARRIWHVGQTQLSSTTAMADLILPELCYKSASKQSRISSVSQRCKVASGSLTKTSRSNAGVPFARNKKLFSLSFFISQCPWSLWTVDWEKMGLEPACWFVCVDSSGTNG